MVTALIVLITTIKPDGLLNWKLTHLHPASKLVYLAILIRPFEF